jgi:peroxidase
MQAGGHTIGAASCGFFAYRVGEDPAMDPGLAQELLGRCPGDGPAAGFAFLDSTTPLRFDNEYYRNLRGGMGVLASDQVLYADPRSRGDVERYAADQDAFFGDFAAAMTRLGRVGVRTAADGEIRCDCRFPN